MRHAKAVEPSFPLTLTLSLGEREKLRQVGVSRKLAWQIPSRI